MHTCATCTNAPTHICTHAHMHTCTHAHIHIYTHAHIHTCTHAHMFDVGVTFEMREPNTEKSIFRFIMIAVSQHLLNGRVKGKVAERQRERGE